MKMNKQRLIIWIIALTAVLHFLFCVLPVRSGLNHYSTEEHTAVFPSSLQYVGEEAFIGTAFRSHFFTDGLLRIDGRAFENAKRLEDVWLPGSIEHVADSAFSDSCIARIYGLEGSYAQKWAEQHHVKFQPVDIWLAAPSKPHIVPLLLFPLLGMFYPWTDSERKRIKNYLMFFIVSMRPQDRPELNPIDYRFP